MDKIKIVHIPDLHVGHAKVPPDLLYQHVQKYIYPALEDTNLVIFNGDFFDTLLNFNHQQGAVADRIIHEVIEMAITHKFFIRVNRGTFYHDRKQNQFFVLGMEQVSDNYQLDGEDLIKVYDSVGLEVINYLGISLLYLPDDLPYDNKLTVGKELMKQAHLDKVDFIINHGYFEHMLPKGMPEMPHGTISEKEVRSIVKGVVLNGHVHTPSIYHKVISGGSFERLAFGEEEDKGFFVLTYEPKSGKLTHKFIINEDALKFTTIDITGLTDEQARAKVVPVVDNLDRTRADITIPIHVRILGEDSVINHSVVDYIKCKYQKIYPTIKSNSSVNEIVVNTTTVTQDLPVVTEQSLPGLISNFCNQGTTKITDAEIMEVLNATASATTDSSR